MEFGPDIHGLLMMHPNDFGAPLLALSKNIFGWSWYDVTTEMGIATRVGLTDLITRNKVLGWKNHEWGKGQKQRDSQKQANKFNNEQTGIQSWSGRYRQHGSR